jgi:hypothetical protein
MKIPHHPCFLFGMGTRRKLLYKGGALYDALTGEILRSWNPIREQILPHEFKVTWQTREGRQYSLEEDEHAVTLKVEGTHTILTAAPVSMPGFQGCGHAAAMRVMLHEVLVNVVEGKPLTNLLVQASPTYRDAAVICEALRQTGNLDLVREWILGLSEPHDYADGLPEADNPGQALFLLSLVSDKEHPLVPGILEAAAALRKFDYIEGRTEGGEHPVYQTKWLKFGLKRLGLPDPYKFPLAFDPFSSVFWMDYRDIPNNGPPFPESLKEAAPHLAWAEAHFHGWDPPMPLPSKAYPLGWEVLDAGRPAPVGMAILDREMVERRIVTPHARHAAEMLLYLLDTSLEAPAREQDLRLLQLR